MVSISTQEKIASLDAGKSAREISFVSTRALAMVQMVCLVVLAGCGFGSILALREAEWLLRPGELDLASALPTPYWLMLAVGTLAGIIILLKSDSDAARTAAVAGIAFLFGPAFLLGIYPGVAGWDTYLHAAPASTLLAGQGIPANNYYAGQYPGTASLLAIVSGATGLSPVEGGILVTAGAGISLTLLWMGIARHWLDSRTSAWAALGVLALTPAILTNDHISPWNVSYVLVWAMVLLLLVGVESPRAWMQASVGALLLGGGTVVVHPFMPIVATVLAGGCALLAWRRGSIQGSAAGWFALMLAVAATAWTIYVATQYFGTGVAFLKNVLLGTQDVADQWTGLSTYEVLKRASTPALSIIALRWAGYAGAGVLALTGLVLRRTRRDVGGVLMIVAASVASPLVGFASEAPWVQRFLYLAPPLLVMAAAISLKGWAERLNMGRRAGLVGALLMGAWLVGSTLVWHPPTLVNSVHPEESTFVVWPQETAAARYVANLNANGPVSVGSDLQTMIIYSYFKPNYSPFDHGISMGSNLTEQLGQNMFMFDGEYVIRSGRQEMVSYGAQDMDPGFWQGLDHNLNSYSERIYDNGFVQVYRR